MTQHAEGRARPLGAPDSKEIPAVASGMDDHALTDSKPGAPSGRALPRRKAPPHGVPSWVKEGSVFFVTICCAVRDENQLCKQEVASSVFEAVDFRQSRGDWYVHLLVLMPDHLHLLVSFPGNDTMKSVISNFKQMTAKKAGICWQQNFFDHRLRSGESFDDKLHYLRMNPVRNGLVNSPEDWPYIWPVISPARPAVAPYLP